MRDKRDLRAKVQGVEYPPQDPPRFWLVQSQTAGSAIFGGPFWLPLVAILTGALVPAVYSLVLYKQLERRGEL